MDGFISWACAFFNSNFFSAFMSALAGAGFGVWGAHALTKRTARKADLQEALRNGNASIVLAATIANEMLTLKKAHLNGVYAEYVRLKGDVEKQLEEGNGNQRVVHAPVNFFKFPPIKVPIESLKKIIYSSAIVPGKSIVLVEAMDQYYSLFAHTLQSHTDQIDEFKRAGGVSTMPLLARYFGLERKGGADLTYAQTMEALKLYTDDVIFFGLELVSVLEEHTRNVRDELKKYSKVAPVATKSDFTEAYELGLVPPRENYKKWLDGFQ